MVRDYETSDFAAMSVLCRGMHKESQYKDLSFSESRLYGACESAKEAFFKVSLIDGIVVGFMTGSVYPISFSDDLVGIDHAMYVDPRFRRGGGGAELIRSFISWCKEKRAKEIRIGVSYGFDSSKHDTVKKLMKGLKFNSSGEWFTRKL